MHAGTPVRPMLRAFSVVRPDMPQMLSGRGWPLRSLSKMELRISMPLFTRLS